MGNMLKVLWKMPLVKHAIKNKVVQQTQNVFNKLVKNYFEMNQPIEPLNNFVTLLKEWAFPLKEEVNILWNAPGKGESWYEVSEGLQYKLKNSVKLKMIIDKQQVLKLKPLNKYFIPPEGMSVKEAFAFKIGSNHYFVVTHHSEDAFVKQLFKNFYYQLVPVTLALTAGNEKKRLEQEIQELKIRLQQTSQKIQEVEKNLKKRLHEIDQIFQVSNELFTIHDREGLINTSLLTLVGQLGCDRAFILLKNRKTDTFSEFYSKGFGIEQNVFNLEETSPIVQYFEEGGEILYYDEIAFKGERAELSTFFKETGAHMVAPVVANEKLIGIMVCGEKLFGGEYDVMDKRIFKVLSNTINLAFTNLEVYEQAAKDAFVDKNTGIANLKYFEKRVQEEKSRALRQNSSLGLLIIELEEATRLLKDLNEESIDRLDRLVVQRLQNVVRTEDFMAYLEPGKYALLLPGISDETINIAIKRFQEKLDAFTPPEELPIKELRFSFRFFLFPDQEEAFETELRQLFETKSEEPPAREDFFSDLDFEV